jgi:hypothetical protein
MFGNEKHSAAMEEFLELLGDRVTLQNFKGFVCKHEILFRLVVIAGSFLCIRYGLSVI